MALRGPKLRNAAEELLLKEHANWKPSEVELDITRVRGSSVVSLVGRGGATECASALINLMMDAYLKTIGSGQTNVSNYIEEAAKAEKELQEAEHAWNSFKLDNDTMHAATNLASLQRRSKQLSSARVFYKREIETSSGLSLEQDIERRRMSSGLPADMPAEFAVIARITPTANEFAYLTALRQTNAVATEAAHKEAKIDSEGRLDSQRRQIEVLGELLAGIQGEINKLSDLQLQAQKIEQIYKSAETAYKLSKERELNDGIVSNDSVAPNVVASVVERASVAVDGH